MGQPSSLPSPVLDLQLTKNLFLRFLSIARWKACLHIMKLLRSWIQLLLAANYSVNVLLALCGSGPLMIFWILGASFAGSSHSNGAPHDALQSQHSWKECTLRIPELPKQNYLRKLIHHYYTWDRLLEKWKQRSSDSFPILPDSNFAEWSPSLPYKLLICPDWRWDMKVPDGTTFFGVWLGLNEFGDDPRVMAIHFNDLYPRITEIIWWFQDTILDSE